MKRISATVSTLAFVLIAFAGCSSTKSSTSSSATTASPPTTASASVTTVSGAPTTAKASTGDAAAFCTKLASEADLTAGFAASIGTPQQAAKLAEIKAANDAILAAAPADIHAAIATVYQVSETARKALDPTLSAADKQAARAAATSAIVDPKVKSAITSYKAWVTANCGSLSSKILSGGL
jgi:hypothetical protein